MTTTILGMVSAVLFVMYLMRRRARLNGEEDNF
jgi:hypothetical protein